MTVSDDLAVIASDAVRFRGAAQQAPELAGLLALVKPGDVVVEVGCDAGGVLWAFQQTDAGRVIGVDLPGGPYSSGRVLDTNGAEMVYGNSRKPSTRDELIAVLDGQPIDLLFIDADHTYKGVKSDWLTFSPLVRWGGLTAFHDICHHKDYPEVQVERLWWEIKAKQPEATSEIVYYVRPWGTGMGIGVVKTYGDIDRG